MRLIPRSTRRLVTDEEIDQVYSEAKARWRRGREKYEGSWTEADLKADLIEECIDLMNYAAHIILRAREVLPDFEGKASNDLPRYGDHVYGRPCPCDGDPECPCSCHR